MPSQEEIFSKVQEALVEALGVEEEEVELEATLTGDLGAESIDFLDLLFRLEKSFDIKIPRDELFPDNLLNDPNFIVEGKFTDTGLEQLKQRMPFADLAEFSKNPQVQDFGNLFTVAMICGYVDSKVNAG
ncbi:MAG: acyl carrier protein [Planctomycetales bacterium]